MGTLSRDDILGFDAGEPIAVDAFGGTIYVRPLSGEERDRYEQSNMKQTRGGVTKLDLTNARARLVAMCLVHKVGGKWERMFGKADVVRLGKLPAAELDKVADVAREASGIDTSDEVVLVEDFGEPDQDETVQLTGVSSS